MPKAKPGPTPDVIACDAEVLAIYISPGHDYWSREGAGRLTHGIQSVAEVECVAGRGLRGDRYFHGKPDQKGQVTLIAAEAIDAIRAEFNLPKLPASVFRRNVVVRGIDLSQLVDQQFSLQGVVLAGSQECKPCDWMDRVVAPGTREFMREAFRGGLRAKIVSGGMLRVTGNGTD